MTRVSQAPEHPATPRAKKKAGGIVVPHAPTRRQRLGAWMVFIFLRLLTATLQFRWDNRSGYTPDLLGGPAIYCLWHNRLMLSMEVYHHQVSDRSLAKGLAVMVSASRDGGFLAAILEAFKIQPVRGSSSRRGPQALLELSTWAERGYDLAITPDGPRGPCYVAQSGVIALAQVTGLPIVPFSYYAHRKIRLNSWDRFQIPLPFSRVDMSLGKPIFVPREITDEQREALRGQLEEMLQELSRD